MAAALNLLWQLGTPSVFVDETRSWAVAGRPLGQVVDGVREIEISPPAYFAGLHSWIGRFGDEEWVMRLPSALLEALSVPCAYLLLRRLVAPATALIAALLWATSPYLIAHSRLLHLDALLTTFVTFSVLCVLIGCQAERRYRWVVAAGVFAGLALLTKGPALIALPFVGLLMFALAENKEQRTENREQMA